MTSILNTKLNRHIINTIREYLLPLKNKKDIIIYQLLYKTQLINYYILYNFCIDKNGNSHNTLTNSKITKVYNNWTIRYKN